MAEESLRHNSSPVSRARQLRSDSTFPERLLWGRLRGRRLAGLKFRRQHPLGHFVLDFYCHEAQLAIELDGNANQKLIPQDDLELAVELTYKNPHPGPLPEGEGENGRGFAAETT